MFVVSLLRSQRSSIISFSRPLGCFLHHREQQHVSDFLLDHKHQRRTMASNGAPALTQQSVHKEAEGIANGEVKVNNWSQPGPAAFDFRSKLRLLYLCRGYAS